LLRPGEKSSRFLTCTGCAYFFAGDPGCPQAPTVPNLDNVAPRLGFAIALQIRPYYVEVPDSTTFHPRLPQQNGQRLMLLLSRINLTDVNFQNPFGSAGIVSFPADFGGVLPGRTLPFTQTSFLSKTVTRTFMFRSGTWNLTIEHELAHLAFERGFIVGNIGYDLSANPNKT